MDDRMKVILEDIMDKPIAFHRIFKTITGSTNAALFLSQAWFWSKTSIVTKRQGWFYKTILDWEEETGLSRREQENARKKCKELGIIEEQLKKVYSHDKDQKGKSYGHATLHFRVNKDKVYELIESANLKKFSLHQTAKLRSLHQTANLLKQRIPTENTPKGDGEIFKNWKDTPQEYHPLFEAMIEGTKNPEPKGQKIIAEWIKQFDDQLDRFGEWLTPKRVREAIREFARQHNGSAAHVVRPKSITHILQTTFEKTRKPAPVRLSGRYENGEYIHD